MKILHNNNKKLLSNEFQVFIISSNWSFNFNPFETNSLKLNLYKKHEKARK